jgi:hypothetical protein
MVGGLGNVHAALCPDCHQGSVAQLVCEVPSDTLHNDGAVKVTARKPATGVRV